MFKQILQKVFRPAPVLPLSQGIARGRRRLKSELITNDRSSLKWQSAAPYVSSTQHTYYF